MKELKFRVWFPENKHMQYCGAETVARVFADRPEIKEFHGNPCPFVLNFNGFVFPIGSVGGYGWPLDNAPVVQQFTGLSDKNNKEIYEGDIVKWQEEVTAGGYNLYNFQVKYSVGSGYDSCLAGFYLSPIRFENNYTRNKFVQTCGLIQNDSPNGFCIRIIGNIFENPELL